MVQIKITYIQIGRNKYEGSELINVKTDDWVAKDGKKPFLRTWEGIKWKD